MEKMSILKLFVYVSVLERVLSGVLGVDGGWMPLPNRPQRYCDPASLVFLVHGAPWIKAADEKVKWTNEFFALA